MNMATRESQAVLVTAPKLRRPALTLKNPADPPDGRDRLCRLFKQRIRT